MNFTRKRRGRTKNGHPITYS